MKLLTTIRRWLSRKPSAHDLLRQVINEDGIDVDRFCTCSATEDDEHAGDCLVSELVEWAMDYPNPPLAAVEYVPPPPRLPLAADTRTAEEIAEDEKRMAGFIETVNALKIAMNHHVVEPVQLSDEERAKIAAGIAPHDFDYHLICRRCGSAMRDVQPGPTHCAITPEVP